MKRWVILLAMLGLVSLTLATPTVQAANKTLYVGTCKETSPYTTIQSAVDAVTGAGFTIAVCPGSYQESVDVANRERLNIRNAVEKGQGMPLIDAGGRDGIVIQDSTNVEIRGLQITNTSMGIIAAHAPETKVRDMVITNARQYGIFSPTATRARHKRTASAPVVLPVSRSAIRRTLPSSRTQSRRFPMTSTCFAPRRRRLFPIT